MTSEQAEQQQKVRSESEGVHAQIVALYDSYALHYGTKASRAAAERKLARLQARLIELHTKVMAFYD